MTVFFFFFFFFFTKKKVTYFMLEMCVCVWGGGVGGVHQTRVENYNPPLKLRKTSVFK